MHDDAYNWTGLTPDLALLLERSEQELRGTSVWDVVGDANEHERMQRELELERNGALDGTAVLVPRYAEPFLYGYSTRSMDVGAGHVVHVVFGEPLVPQYRKLPGGRRVDVIASSVSPTERAQTVAPAELERAVFLTRKQATELYHYHESTWRRMEAAGELENEGSETKVLYRHDALKRAIARRRRRRPE